MARRSLLAAFALVVLALSGAARPAAAADLEIWQHGIVAAKSDSGFAMMAADHGFAAKQGLKIETLQLNGDALLLKALLAGEIDSYDGSPGGPLIAASHGADIKLVGCYWPGLTYALFSKKAVSLDHLSGKIFGISSPGALPDLLARATLDKYGVSPAAARFVVMGSDSERFQALAAGVIDVAAISIEFEPVAAKQGLKLLVPAREVVPNYLRFCTYMTGKTIATRRAAAVRFLAAEMAAYRYALAHRDEEIALARETIHAKPDDPRLPYVFDEVVRAKAIVPDMPIPLDKLEWMQELLVKTGNLVKPIDLTKLVDDSLRTQALTLAGP
jgi:NitT/TauT family transport system substrate-binding protein